MIEVKGTKTTTPEAVAAYDRFLLKSPDKKTATPLYFGIALTGIALYLKSIFPSHSEVSPVPVPEPRPEPEAGLAPAPVQVVVEHAQTEPQRPTEPEAMQRGASGSSGRLLDPAPRARFVAIDSPMVDAGAFDFSRPDFLKSFGSMNFSVAPANDNVAPGGNSGGDGGPATGGPGDGGETPKPNRAPRSSGPVQLYDVFGCAAALIALSDLLRNASDPDGDALNIRNITVSSGTLTQTMGGWMYSATGLGPVTVTYQVSDGQSFVTQTAHFSVLRNKPVVGTDDADMLIGTKCADDISGGDGDDNIDARAGDDAVDGGNGNDHIVGGAGNDVIYAGFGDDVVFGGAGADVIYGEQGNDRLFGDEGRDTLYGGDGHDRLWGGDDHDMLFGEAGNDELAGEAGNDHLDGGDGEDVLSGGAGRDRLFGADGNDSLDGGDGDDFLSGGAGCDLVKAAAGNDTVLADSDHADDAYDGGEGTDTIDYSASATGIIFDLEAGTATGFEIGNDSIVSFEQIVGGSGDDLFMVGGQASVLRGGDGNDTFQFDFDADDSGIEIVHKILDFMVGDRIKASKYEIFEEVLDTLEDRFEAAYGDQDTAQQPIRITHEGTDDLRQTLIEIDADGDQNFETAIALSGHHVLMLVETA